MLNITFNSNVSQGFFFIIIIEFVRIDILIWNRFYYLSVKINDSIRFIAITVIPYRLIPSVLSHTVDSWSNSWAGLFSPIFCYFSVVSIFKHAIGIPFLLDINSFHSHLRTWYYWIKFFFFHFNDDAPPNSQIYLRKKRILIECLTRNVPTFIVLGVLIEWIYKKWQNKKNQ